MKVKAFFIGIILSVISNFAYSQQGYGLSFDGTDDYVSIPHNDIFNVSKVTIEMWMYWENITDPNAVNFLIAKNFEELEIHTGGSNAHGLRFIPTLQVYLDTDPDVFQSNSWYHIAFIYDPSIPLYKCFINGVEKTLTSHGPAEPGTAITQSLANLNIGRRSDNYYHFQGMIDELRIWNEVRSQAEIQANMNVELAGNETGLIAYYKMSDGNGTVLTDNSVNGNNGTLMNGTQWKDVNSTLPIQLSSFIANLNGSAVTLNWKTETEVNNYGFEIERSKISVEIKEWTNLGFVKGHVLSNSEKVYSFTDKPRIKDKYAYRLKQIDNDGKFEYSKEIEVNQLPSNFSLEQNFPNPFNPVTTIRYSVASNQNVSLKVYDLLGNEVSTLVNEVKQPGTYEVIFDGSRLASGVYLYKLQRDSYTQTKKFVLMK